MIRKLRIKLVIAAMLSLLLVLLVIFAVAGALNYREIIVNADSVLAILQENDGTFPKEEATGKVPSGKERFPKEKHRFSPELPYESRYFSVFLTGSGKVISVDTGKIAAVDTEAAIHYALAVAESGRTRGFWEDYRYTVYTADEETRIIFLDCSREMNSFRTYLFIIVGVAAVGLLAVLLLLIFLSGRIVKPFSENYEKQKRFITDAGHELKTPLTVIDADAELLEMDIGENEWLSDIQTQTKRLSQLTNSLIQLARMEEQPQTERIEFPLSDLVEETLDSFRPLAKTHGKTLAGHIQPMLSMCGDEKAIRQLVMILLDNAVKYSDDNGRIELILESRKNGVCLSVFNTAESVQRESLAHFFERFYRADPSRNSGTGGYGLGLSIAMAIVTSHKGKISASTQDEKSLLITVTFPT